MSLAVLPQVLLQFFARFLIRWVAWAQEDRQPVDLHTDETVRDLAGTLGRDVSSVFFSPNLTICTPSP